jgi:hypothetical protein
VEKLVHHHGVEFCRGEAVDKVRIEVDADAIGASGGNAIIESVPKKKRQLR